MINKNIVCLIACLCLLCNSALAQNVPDGTQAPSGSPTGPVLPQPFSTPLYYNYVREWRPVRPISDTSVFALNSINTSPVVTTYLNGWGRSLEVIKHGLTAGSKQSSDILIPIDNRKSLTKNTFLPYSIPRNSHFQLNPFTDQRAYYVTQFPYEGATALSQQQITYDVNGLRHVNSYAPGSTFVGQKRGGDAISIFNRTNEVVKYTILNSGMLAGFGTYYSAGQLIVKATTGPNSNIMREYYSLDQKLICKKVFKGLSGTDTVWLTTYYVYDDLGRLALIIPPKANAANPTSANFNSLIKPYCFSYVYDQYDNIIQKFTPGEARSTYIVYDKKQRPVMTQTPRLFAQNKWEYTIYDSRDRIILMGVITDTNSYATWQGWANGSKPLPATTFDPVTGLPITTLQPFVYYGFQGTYPSYIANGNIRVVNYYDNYTYDTLFSSRQFDSSFKASYETDVYSVTPRPFGYTQGLLTARKTSVDSGTNFQNQWISTVYFYDQKGRVIQAQTLNPWNTTAWDILTTQYNFSGQPVLTIQKTNSWTGCNKPQTTIYTAYNYDNFDGKIESVEQRTDSNGWVDISDYVYDKLRKVSRKTIGGVEIQDFAFNIRGQLAGINADYTASPFGIADKSFGCVLNYDYGFSQIRLDGNIAGMQWRSAGNPTMLRAYGYTYDSAGRLIGADYRQQVSTWPPTYGVPWSHSTEDYSMYNVSYDANGNLLTMNHMGTPPGASAPVPIDVLRYTYDNGNSLLSVSDSVKINYNLGDFQDSTPCKTCHDYNYDENGNLIADGNKKISSISYNELDEPVKVIFPFGSINNVYDGQGNLLQKIISNDTLGTKDTIRYWGVFNYKNDSLEYILHNEGRARWLPDSSKFKYDYFVKDHLGNVRTVVTSDISPDPVNYFASHEVASAKLEYSIFANIANVADNNPDPPGPYNQMAARLNGSDPSRQVGTALLLHVMAGDKFDISANSYWDDSAYSPITVSPPEMLNAIVGTLVSGAGGFNNGENGSNVVNSLFSSSNYLGIYNGILDSLADTTIPQAFINYVVFDNNMNVVASQSGAIQVDGTSGSWQSIGTSAPITINQNGYVAVYMSDRSWGNIYMDNLSVRHYQGRLMQEQHYYPFGLSINEGNSFNTLPNKYLCQTNEVHTELGLNQSDFNFRQYDYQIGRFTSIDPLAASQESFSPYHAFGDNPASVVDPMGLDDNEGSGSDPFGDGTMTASLDMGGDNGAAMLFNPYFFMSPPSTGTFIAPFSLDFTSLTITTVSTPYTLGQVEADANPSIPAVVLASEVPPSMPIHIPDESPTLQAQNPALQAGVAGLLGVGDAVVDIGKGLYGAVTSIAHPVTTYNNVKNYVYNQMISGAFLPYGHSDLVDQFDNTNTTFGKSYMIGHFVAGLLPMFVAPEAEVGEVAEFETVSEEQGGLNLFKFKSPQAETPNNWKTGDRFLKMYDQGSPKLNWKQNSGFLRAEMNKGNPIFDSYLDVNGNLQSTRGFLNAERYLLLDRGWQFDVNIGAWMPPK